MIPLETPLTVKPRKSQTNAYRPIIAAHGDDAYFERHNTGEVRDLTEALRELLLEPPSIIVCQDPQRLLAKLYAIHQSNPWFFAKFTPVTRKIERDGNALYPKDTIVTYFGWVRKGVRGQRDRPKLIHYVFSPLTIAKASIHDLRSGDESPLQKTYEWGMRVRNFLVENDLRIPSTGGAIGAQLLKDSRFYPRPRRKVPKATNELARPTLPGNHYDLRAESGRLLSHVTEVDMAAAHHHFAGRVTLPCANDLYARGNFRTYEKGERWIREPQGHGLFYCAVSVPHGKDNAFTLPQLQKHGRRNVFLYSNEIGFARENGVFIDYIIAGWSSEKEDTGLTLYSQFAQGQLRTAGRDKTWLKPVLLSPYGLLATRPHALELGFVSFSPTAGTPLIKGNRSQFMLRGGLINAHHRTTSKESEPCFNNIIHRGMIEAQTRIETLRMATYLRSYGHDILALYGDAVFVTPDAPIPFLPPPWRIKTEHTNMVFYSPTSWESDQDAKLPGIPREHRERVSRRSQFRALTADHLSVILRDVS